MTLAKYISKLCRFAVENPTAPDLEVVFHDTDGLAAFDVDVSVDNTCNDDERVVRINMIEVE